MSTESAPQPTNGLSAASEESPLSGNLAPGVRSGFKRAKTPAPVFESWEATPQQPRPHHHRSRHRKRRPSLAERLRLALPALSLAMLVAGLLACVWWIIWG
ncbi:MAG: hypothetical protein ACFUZC_22950 [Chthoniobacteraceae bacterium]